MLCTSMGLNAFEKVDFVNENKVLISHCKIEFWIANIARSCNVFSLEF